MSGGQPVVSHGGSTMEMSPLIPKAKDTVITLDYGTYAIPAGPSDVASGVGFGGKPAGSSGGGGTSAGDDGGAASPTDDNEEESMDWWTKYFASVDAMIEVRWTKYVV